MVVLGIVMVWVVKFVGVDAGVVDAVVAGDCFWTSDNNNKKKTVAQ